MYGQEQAPEQKVQIEGQFYNVKEDCTLTDTVVISGHVDQMASAPQGWFATFAQLGAASSIPFFNVRNQAQCGVAFNNQQTRDNAPYGMRIESIACRWITPSYGYQFRNAEGTPPHLEWGPIFSSILPFHAGVTLRIQQDIKLESQAAMLSGGGGAVMGGWGYGGVAPEEYAAYQAVNMGVEEDKNRFSFPEIIDIPNRAAIEATLVFSDWARNLLQHIMGPSAFYVFSGQGAVDKAETPVYCLYGIQLILKGKRLVPQRGALHA